MAAHRYWRFLFGEAMNGGGYITIGEVELRISVGGADQTGSGSSDSDSSYVGYPSSNAFANNGSSYVQSWVSTSGYPHWLSYDFGSGNEKDIIEYTITSSSNHNEAPLNWRLQYSDNNFDWTILRSEVVGSWSDQETKTFSAVPVTILGRCLNNIIRRDVADGGALSIIEPVTRMNAVPPQRRHVRLYDRVCGRAVRAQWSDKVTGHVNFQNLRAGKWDLLAHDHTYEFEAVAISDRESTVDGLRP